MPAEGWTTIKTSAGSAVLSASARTVYSVAVSASTNGILTRFAILDDGTGSGTSGTLITIQSGTAAGGEATPQLRFRGARFENGVTVVPVTGSGTVMVELA